MTAVAPTPPRAGPLNLAARFVYVTVAAVIAYLPLRAAELWLAAPPGLGAVAWGSLLSTAAANDALGLLRHWPVLCVLALPVLWLPVPRVRYGLLLLIGGVVLAAQAALIEYFLDARVPLGADLFGYSMAEISETVRSGAGWHPLLLVALIMAWALYAIGLRRALQREDAALPSPQTTLLAFALALAAAWWLPAQRPPVDGQREDRFNMGLSKSAFFADDSWRYWRPQAPAPVAAGQAVAAAATDSEGHGLRYLDPAYPFLRAEQTPDALGPLFRVDPARPPNFVFIVVEGLGRSFSGPDAGLGSFTPFLDELAERSLYFDNFLATQGRTFAVLPSLLASLPFGENGFNALGAGMPAHASLPGVLKAQGYSLAFYAGFNADFDNERTFLHREGFDRLLDMADYPSGAQRTNDWGYADGALVDLALADQARRGAGPRLDLLQTISMHTPYTVPDQARWRARVDQRLDELGVLDRSGYRVNRDIYATVLYTDDALRRYFERAKTLPGYENTIFIVTGDHRLPEIPMATRIDRYHVPLIVFSPLLREPRRVRAVSSDFDVAPSLLAFLGHQYRLRTPPAVTWVGTGLDLSTSFRNIHDIPLKQTKTNLVDFVSGTHFLNQDRLYALRDGMQIAPVDDAEAMAQLQARFDAFRTANDRFARSLVLMPPERVTALAAYDASERPEPVAITVATADLAVREVRPDAAASGLTVDAVFANDGAAPSEEFVPLVVLAAADGHEMSETYGAPMRLGPGQSVRVPMSVKRDGVAAGHYFVSVIPSHPKTGKSMGLGRYRIPVQVDD